MTERRLPSLSALRAFEAAARHLSFGNAAKELFVTQSAISRHVRGLEDHLGTKLFVRLNRRVELTSTARDYAAVLRDCFDRMAAATLAITGAEQRRSIALSVLPTFAMRWLAPRLSAFLAAHPGLEVRLSTSSDPVDFVRDGVDAAIRVGPPPADEEPDQRMAASWDGVEAEPLLPDRLTLVCSPALLAAGGGLGTAADLVRYRLLHTTTRGHAWRDWCRAAGQTPPQVETEQWFGHFFMTQQAARDGVGVAVLPSLLVAEDLHDGTLIDPLGPGVTTPSSYCLLYPTRQARSPDLRLLRDWLLREAKRADPPGINSLPAPAPPGRTDPSTMPAAS